MCDFEKKVYNCLVESGLSEESRIGAAVSGGADSISLLLALSEIFHSLYVITVNHNIRPAAESRGDVDFVLEVCGELRRMGREIVCDVVELETGSVDKEAKIRGGGTEDAARSLRYKAFDSFIKKYNLDILCLAHNKNDQLETILMRFLQGSVSEAAGGIRRQRGQYLRPLLDISRDKIEEYVKEKGFCWRTDKTNSDTDYLRNKIRHKLIPFLDSEFSGWKSALLAGAEKASEDAKLISSLMPEKKFSLNSDGSLEISLKEFLSEPDAIQQRILLEAFNAAGLTTRIPHLFLKDIITSLKDSSEKNFSKRFSDIEILKKKDLLLIKKYHKDNTDLVFSDIIENSGEFEFPFGLLSVFNIEEKMGEKTASISIRSFSKDLEYRTSTVEKIRLPFLIRSIQLDDTILTADGSEKKVSDILSDWHLLPEQRPFVPLVQLLDDNTQRIKCVLAGYLGYKDWIVKL